MIKPVIVVCCLFVSYFVVFLIINGYWGPALMYGIYGSVVFSLTLFGTSLFSQGRPWRAFWIANIALILLFAGLVVYGLTLNGAGESRTRGMLFMSDDHITPLGFAVLALNVLIYILCNFMGFYLARYLIKLFDLE